MSDRQTLVKLYTPDLLMIIVSPFVHIFEIISLFVAELQEPKIVIIGKGLNVNIKQITKLLRYKVYERAVLM